MGEAVGWKFGWGTTPKSLFAGVGVAAGTGALNVGSFWLKNSPEDRYYRAALSAPGITLTPFNAAAILGASYLMPNNCEPVKC